MILGQPVNEHIISIRYHSIYHASVEKQWNICVTLHLFNSYNISWLLVSFFYTVGQMKLVCSSISQIKDCKSFFNDRLYYQESSMDQHAIGQSCLYFGFLFLEFGLLVPIMPAPHDPVSGFQRKPVSFLYQLCFANPPSLSLLYVYNKKYRAIKWC